MNIKPITAALATLALLSTAAAAFAAPIDVYDPTASQNTVKSTKSRQQVIDEVVQARANGTLITGELGYAATVDAPNAVVLSGAGKTRAEVIAELRQARSDGTFDAGGEVEKEPVTVLADTPRSRAEVRAEAIQSARNGRFAAGELLGN